MKPEDIAKAGSEHAHQTALFCAISQPEIQAKYPELMLAFAIPNGGMRDKRTAAMLKAEGVKSGVWDILLPVASGEHCPGCKEHFSGLFVEMKVKPNRLTFEQHAFYAAMQRHNFDFFVAYTWQEAFDKMVSYLGER